ncbi:helix-turn-helix domain-containing protein [Actinoplanes sp. TBRC 11911]|uniref:helix-turn-helix domain-containing protein n=1 Tax=Actinoplanes sp. TBRC 11911 TaxID=2729386 RepID=UPI00145CF309|nr:helix-turn-helix transcriptional regulator [Actinoplanes sp. TBRC 11911]NMO53150.1 helix-turn-helix domain-containing protein [Actinoplanes sp. TBRC 11911]
MSNEPSPDFVGPDSDEPVGEALARMRKARRLTGAELAAQVAMSQPKISRIERGQVLADPADIALIAQVLGADEATIGRLVERTERGHDRLTDLRPTSIDLSNSQKAMIEWESTARETRCFESVAITGLLQTGAYARAVLRGFQRLAQGGTTQPSQALVAKAVAERTRRQEILADPTRSFRFVMIESVFRNRICSPVDMLGQIEHLQDVVETFDNVVIGIVPDMAPLPIPPMHGFALLDDKLVSIDAFNTAMVSRGRRDVQRYRQLFDAFESLAQTDIAGILTRYRRLYIDLLRDLDDRSGT